ncbi:MAG: hypothetical protein K2X87_34050 [Gemmataceae bacterium]|nr:hypothetical protein [Gemmataceae bacterium]
MRRLLAGLLVGLCSYRATTERERFAEQERLRDRDHALQYPLVRDRLNDRASGNNWRY